MFQNVAILGVGLIGGSIGLAIKSRNPKTRVIGVGRNSESLARARAAGIIDTFHTDTQKGMHTADFVVVCTPVDRVADDVAAVAELAPKSALITDVGSTKRRIVETLAERMPSDGPTFVGSHPLAGSEKRGADHAKPDLFQNRKVILTPNGHEPAEAVSRVEEFWRWLGAEVISLSPEEHDNILAITSHLPHVAAAAVSKLMPPEWLTYTGSGFRDSTRVASGDAGLWAAIFRENQGPVREAVRNLIEQLQQFEQSLSDDSVVSLTTWLADAKRVRDALGS